MTYLLNMETRRDKFQKHTRVLFDIKYVLYDGNCGYRSIFKYLKLSYRCTNNNIFSLIVRT